MKKEAFYESLFPYQKIGVDFLASRDRALLADEMGLGKTPQAIRAANLRGFSSILVICPASLKSNWLREFRKFWIGKQPERLSVESYDSFWRKKTFEHHCSLEYDLIICDEAHMLKNPKAKRTKAIYPPAGILTHQGHASFWALSGTPAPNHAGELWPLLHAFGCTEMTYDEFTQKHCNRYQVRPYVWQITGTKSFSIEVIRRMLEPIILRRKKLDVLKDLPPIFFYDVAVEGDKYLDSSIKDKVREELSKVEALLQGVDYSDSELLGVLEIVAGSVSTLRRYCGYAKVAGVANLIEEELKGNAYKKIVIFAIHKDVIESLKYALRKFFPIVVTGSTPTSQRGVLVEKFQNLSKHRVFIGNIKAAGTGLTLTAANQVAFVEQEWTPGDNVQAAMRCHRIGQKFPVTIRTFGLVNSIDEKISAALSRKTRELAGIFDLTNE